VAFSGPKAWTSAAIGRAHQVSRVEIFLLVLAAAFCIGVQIPWAGLSELLLTLK